MCSRRCHLQHESFCIVAQGKGILQAGSQINLSILGNQNQFKIPMRTPIVQRTVQAHDKQCGGKGVTLDSFRRHHGNGGQPCPGRIPCVRVENVLVNLTVLPHKIVLISTRSDHSRILYGQRPDIALGKWVPQANAPRGAVRFCSHCLHITAQIDQC